MTPPTPTATPNDSASIVRFRDRVRSRAGTAELFVFRLGDERFGFDLRAVDEVLEEPEITALPDAIRAVEGVCRHKGAMLVVVRADLLLGVDEQPATTVLVMRRGDDRIGMLVEDVEDVERVDLSALRNPPHEADELLLAVLWSDGRLISLLDARAMVAAGAALLQRSAT
jgi:purine-binding chemotaxis protein CheW